jgi:hypothetical protein
MKKAETREPATTDDMRPEYAFSTMKGAVRGKYYKVIRSLFTKKTAPTWFNTSSSKTERLCWNRT